MRMLIALIVIVYLIGVGVALAPTVEGKWNTATAAELTATVGQALPHAFAWPVAAYHSITGKDGKETGDAAK
jgi:hypothetical protein